MWCASGRWNWFAARSTCSNGLAMLRSLLRNWTHATIGSLGHSSYCVWEVCLYVPRFEGLGCFLNPDTPRLETIPVSLSGGLREDSSGCHAFFFIRRRGIVMGIVLYPTTTTLEATYAREFVINLFAVLVPDVPRNMKIVVEGPARNHYTAMDNDVVALVKRWASDGSLAQDHFPVQFRF